MRQFLSFIKNITKAGEIVEACPGRARSISRENKAVYFRPKFRDCSANGIPLCGDSQNDIWQQSHKIAVGVAIVGGFYVWYNYGGGEKVINFNKTNKTMTAPTVKKALMVVASENFRDEEYFAPKKILEEAGIEIKTASDKAGIAKGAVGGKTTVDMLLTEANVADFDAIIFIGGAGALENLDNEASYNLARAAVGQGKLLAAICISPVILARAGVLDGKRTTVWSSASDKSPIKILEENGAEYVGGAVVADGKIITADGPAAAKEFGEKITRDMGQ